MEPNPVVDNLNIYFGNSSSAERIITLTDLTGRVLLKTKTRY